MDIETVRRFCLSLPGAIEDVKWEGDLTFLIGEKMFAVVGLEPTGPAIMSFKCTPEDFAELTERPGLLPAPYLARHHWVALESYDALPDEELKKYLKRSYQLVLDKLPKKVRQKVPDG